MASYFVIVRGTKGVPIGGRKEFGNGRPWLNTATSSGVEYQPLNTKVLCREGDEQTVISRKGAKCSYNHTIKEGAIVYDLGSGRFACPSHIVLIPTFEKLEQKYKAHFYLDVTFEVMK